MPDSRSTTESALRPMRLRSSKQDAEAARARVSEAYEFIRQARH